MLFSKKCVFLAWLSPLCCLGHVYIMDGTWASENGGNGMESRTNCQRMRDHFSGPGKVFYFRGVGNDQDHGVAAQYFEGLTGYGSKKIVDEVYNSIVENWHIAESARHEHWIDAEEVIRDYTAINLVGWSRGAAIAVEVAWLIYLKGIPSRVLDGVLLRPGERCPIINQIHLMDTVHSMDVPGNDVNTGWHDYNLPPNVRRCYHYLAAAPPAFGFKQTRFPAAWEEFHCGGHGDIGGSTGSICSEEVYRSIVCNALKGTNKARLYFEESSEIVCPVKVMRWGKDGMPVEE